MDDGATMMQPPPARPRVLLFSSLYPSSVRPTYATFVDTRLREVLSQDAIEARVVAPVPWFPSTAARFGEYALFARTPARETRNGIDVQHPRYAHLPKVGMSMAPLAMALGAVPALRRLRAEGFDFDLIDAHYYYPDGVAAALLARWFDRPLAITARGSDINLLAQYAAPRAWMRWASRVASASIAVSSALADRMSALGVPADRISVLRNGVDLTRFRPLPQAQARSMLGWPDAPTLIAVGNLLENKGQHLAIQALAALPGFRLHIVGGGPQAKALAELAAQIGVTDRVRFFGSVAQDELALHYSAADALVLASSREGAPNVVLEAMACGVPVVATAVGGIPEVMSPPITGALLAERTADALAVAVRGLWSRGFDRDAIRRHAQGFGWTQTTRAQIAMFRRMASRSRIDDASSEAAGRSAGGVR